jgi:peptidyl-tRNA hydrolase, PTH1 family
VFLVVGLGNPGREYEKTRHNVGFEAVDGLQAERGFAAWKTSGNAEVARGKVGSVDTLLLKPQTYMNLSGEAVGSVMRFYKVAESELIVVHDELDFEPGILKVKVGGGHGGNNGVKSIISHCGREFVRVRVGIGKPRGDGANWVLGRFDKSERELVESALQLAKQAVLTVIEKGVQTAMNEFNRREAP